MPRSSIQPCPKCAGKRTSAFLTSYGGVQLVQERHGSIDALFGKNRSDLDAIVCINCGYTEFYARKPKNLLPDS